MRVDYAPPADGHSELAVEATQAAGAVAESTNLTDTAPRSRFVLLVATRVGSDAIELASGESLTIGRTAPADVRVDEAKLSRQHARFTCEGEAVRVVDLGSRNGTWSHGERVQEAVLRPGDQVVLGNVTVSVQSVVSPNAAKLGLSSFAAVLGWLREEWLRAQSFRRSFAVLVIRPLREHRPERQTMAAACIARLGGADRVALYEQHSLLVLLPETTEPAALRIARELCAVESTSDGRQPSAGCGVACYPDAGATPEELVSAAWRACRRTTERNTVVVAPACRGSEGEGEGEAVVRASPAMRELEYLIERVAPRPIPVLITGETGVGKELVARELHRLSKRQGLLRIVNCAAIPEHLLESLLFGHVRGSFTGADRDHKGVFEQANAGTVFLDEVGELPLEAQAALLRVLDTRQVSPVGSARDIQVDVRVVAATHRNLAELTTKGTFRLDLYHRLNAMILHLPPLRERKQEIRPLVEHFLARISTQWGGSIPTMSADALACLEDYAWPGNVRELRNVIERAVALCEAAQITRVDLPEHVQGSVVAPASPEALEFKPVTPQAAAPTDEGGGLRALVDAYEAELIRSALQSTGGHQRKAAELLKVPLRTFERKLSNLGDRSDGD